MSLLAFFSVPLAERHAAVYVCRYKEPAGTRLSELFLSCRKDALRMIQMGEERYFACAKC